ncbi:MAG: hypothetical protein CMQ41_15190 [Gammaproteobacteria bacterium]|nr:hypothetical protein [Gammaproteobacteria bacterium]
MSDPWLDVPTQNGLLCLGITLLVVASVYVCRRRCCCPHAAWWSDEALWDDVGKMLETAFAGDEERYDDDDPLKDAATAAASIDSDPVAPESHRLLPP